MMCTSTIVLCVVFCHIFCYVLAAPTPHVLFIVVDDLGFTDTGYHGAEFNTSNIDSLALSGIDLTNYYVMPTCTPTRARYRFIIGLANCYLI